MVTDTLELSPGHILRHYRRASRSTGRWRAITCSTRFPTCFPGEWVDDSHVAVDVEQMSAFAWPEAPALTAARTRVA